MESDLTIMEILFKGVTLALFTFVGRGVFG